ncbi:CAZy family GT8 glycosyltransferase [Medicago truncatula]|uniref:CAZy family GT8 glycosyltransferase n=1 Tax=Medicago truncatula TaxID=3880 RepID=G7JF31_MEDTR|nr:CAZy family GT8 glycosyltransferase [Medicago truncatula]
MVNGNVHTIDPFRHMLRLGYQENTTKPWLDIIFPKLRPLWTKYVDFSDNFIKSCHIIAS